MFLISRTLPTRLLLGYGARPSFSHYFEMHNWRQRALPWPLFEPFSRDGRRITKHINICLSSKQLCKCLYLPRPHGLSRKKWLLWETKRRRIMQQRCWMSSWTLRFGMPLLGNIFSLQMFCISWLTYYFSGSNDTLSLSQLPPTSRRHLSVVLILSFLHLAFSWCNIGIWLTRKT